MTICETDYTLIGYSEYDCDLTTGVYAGDLVDSDVLSMHSSCTNSTGKVNLGSNWAQIVFNRACQTVIKLWSNFDQTVIKL